MSTPNTNLPIEDHLPSVKYNGGLYSALPALFAGDLTVLGTTNIANVSLVDLSTTGNTTLGNGGADTTTIVSASATALTVGPNGATNPVLQVDGSTASQATGLKLTGAAAASGFAIAVISSGTDENLTINAKGAGTITLGNVSTGRINVNTSQVITTTGANGFIVGANGVTNAVFQVNANAASVATGVRVVGAAAGSGVAIAAISSGTDESITFNAKGAGLVSVGGISTGLVKVGQGSAKQLIQGGATAALGTTQNSTPTAAQLLGGIVTQTSATGAGTVTLPLGSSMSAAITGVAVGDSFHVRFANLGGGQTLTITANTNFTVVGTATVATATNIDLLMVNTATDTWICYTNK